MPDITREQAQYTLGGQRAGRTVEIYMALMSKAVAAIDDGTDEFVALLIRPGNNVRITFKKEPPPESQPEPTFRHVDEAGPFTLDNFKRWKNAPES